MDGSLFLRDCFMKYVATKVLKRLESNKIRGGFNDPSRTLLLPVSFGVSSIALLHVLDEQLHKREEQGRHAGFKLHILFIDQSTVVAEAPPQTLIELLRQRYPSHLYTTISIDRGSEYGIDVGEVLSDTEGSLKDRISSLSSASSKVDFVNTIRRRLILAYAKRNECNSVLFGDSTTRLAERTLSETAKGRGIALPWLTADGNPSGVNCTYPLRDVLKKELLAYAEFVSPPLTPLMFQPLAQNPSSSKDTTIDGLMSQYFETVEQNFPSIVANVVRTSGKLVGHKPSEYSEPCSLCGSPIVNGTWGGEQDTVMPMQDHENTGASQDKNICYGCARTV